jgi:transcriptional regulator with XRE-family HTH domain
MKLIKINATKVEKALHACKMTTRSIAAKTGVSQSNIVKLMHADATGHTPRTFTMVRIAKGLGITRGSLMH